MAAATLGERLREARITKQLRQADVAEALGVSHVKISQWETGVHVPTAGNLDRLAQLYGVTTEWLLRGDGNPALIENVTRGTVREAADRYAHGASSAMSALPPELDRIRSDFKADFVRAGISALELQLLDRLLYAPELTLILQDSPRPEASLDRLLRALSSWLMDQISIRGGVSDAQKARLASRAGRRDQMERLIDIVDQVGLDVALPPGVKQSEGGDPVERPTVVRKRSGKPA